MFCIKKLMLWVCVSFHTGSERRMVATVRFIIKLMSSGILGLFCKSPGSLRDYTFQVVQMSSFRFNVGYCS